MKKRSLISLLLAFMLILTFTACADNNTHQQVVLSDVISSINTECSLDTDNLMLIETAEDLELYYNILPEDVKQFAAETTLNSSTDITEIILVEAVDSDAAQRVYDCLDVRYNSQRDLCASYSAELLAIVNMCEVTQNGNFVTLIMSEDTADITAHYNSFFS